ncbi:MAG TPA: glutamate--tRNA ligase [Thermomicrobiales bacterium]
MTTDQPTPTIDPNLPVVRVRFPPSPTGLLHVGGARTALYNWLFAYGQAKREGKPGQFIIRIEDTDRARYVPGAAEALLDILEWFGLTWDEGPDKGGPYGPYVQSERIEIYREHAEKLVESGHAYPCFCSPERLQKLREEQQARGLPPGYDRHCRNLPREEAAARVAAGEPHVIRFAMPREGETRIYDLIRGEIVFENAKLEDLVLLKSDGFPTYHLANVVDDHHMRVTHIMRGEEWIPTAPVHAQLYRAFGWEMPAIAHMPLILAPGGGKLSKRHGSTALEEFRAQGYLPEALMNYLALVGWSLDGVTEIFSKEDLLKVWSLERVSPSPATFDYKKLLWFNQYYINHIISLDDLTSRVVPFLAREGLADPAAADPSHPDFPRIREVVALFKDRLETLAQAPELMSYFLRDELEPYDPALLVPKKTEPAAVLDALVATLAILEEMDVADEAGVEARLRALAEERGLKAGQLFMPIRVAITGRDKSPGLFETMRVIGNERVRSRLAAAIELLRERVGAGIGSD